MNDLKMSKNQSNPYYRSTMQGVVAFPVGMTEIVT